MPENTSNTTQHTEETSSNPVTQVIDKTAEFAAFKANPGPAVPQNMPEQEGTKEEREAKAQELNK